MMIIRDLGEGLKTRLKYQCVAQCLFSSRSEKQIFFDIDIVIKYKSKCGLTWFVLLSTSSTCHHSGQNLLWTHLVRLAEPRDSTTFGPL